MRAVKGMLPKNKLRQVRLDRLKVFAEDGPTPYDLNVHKDYRKSVSVSSVSVSEGSVKE